MIAIGRPRSRRYRLVTFFRPHAAFQILGAARRSHLGKQLGGPKSQALESLGHRLLELHVRLNLALRGEADDFAVRARREDAVPGQDAVLQVDVQSPGRRVASACR